MKKPRNPHRVAGFLIKTTHTGLKIRYGLMSGWLCRLRGSSKGSVAKTGNEMELDGKWLRHVHGNFTQLHDNTTDHQKPYPLIT